MSFFSDRIKNGLTVAILITTTIISAAVVRNKTGNGLKTLKELTGIQVDSLILNISDSVHKTLSLRSKQTILYQFATECPYCAAQKEHVKRLLTSLRSNSHLRVLTASDEDASVTRGYWQPQDVDLEEPLSLSQSSLAILHGYTVPRLYFIDTSGSITMAVQGTIGGWTLEDLQKHIR